MKPEIYIISGFLGSGKTTFIMKLLKEVFCYDNVAIIENDFGNTNIDSALLKKNGVNIREISAGCICCSMSEDFVKSIRQVTETFHPSKIIIEPSGVAKLSDIVIACKNSEIINLVDTSVKITAVDIKRCRMYFDNFGEFFEDQIKNADIVMLSRTKEYPDKTGDAISLVKTINPNAILFSEPWDEIQINDILSSVYQKQHKIQILSCMDTHHNHEHEHRHNAEESFDKVTIKTDRTYQPDELKFLMDRTINCLSGTIVRAKGILQGTKGYINLQYVQGELKINLCNISGNTLCFIGEKLESDKISDIWGAKI